MPDNRCDDFMPIKQKTQISFLLLFLGFMPAALWAQDAPAEIVSDAAGMSDIAKLTEAIKDLQSQLEAQSKKIKELEANYGAAVDAKQQELEEQQKVVSEQDKKIDIQREAMQSLQQKVDVMVQQDPEMLSDQEKKLRSLLETVESSIKVSQQAEDTSYDTSNFPGSIPIPGSSAALRIGGFVKMNIVESFDPIGSKDRFTVGEIPVPSESAPNVSSISVNQTRLNFDLRDVTPAGPLRAFIEGDFDGGNSADSDADVDQFRLRHAFGQYKDLLAGKTWSTFMDFDAIPEDLDFEGINGQINLRQAQLRYFPAIGKNWNLLVSLEDPNPEIGNGSGLSNLPDLIVSIRREWFTRWHVKTALLIRQLEGTCAVSDDVPGIATDTTCATAVRKSETGWAVSFSGKTAINFWDDARDNLLFQFNYGEGYSHYVNDLNSIGEPDAVFDTSNGSEKLKTLPVFAYYAAMQKWWSDDLRSNFNYSVVDVDNESFQLDDAYRKTRRASANIIWSPTPRVDFGAEFLYGYRQNKNKESSNAAQLQVSGTYRY